MFVTRIRLAAIRTLHQQVIFYPNPLPESATRLSCVTSKRCLATAAPAGDASAGAGKEKPAKKAKDPFKELSFKLLDRDAKLDDVTELVLNTPEANFNNVNTAIGLYRLGRLLGNAADKTTWERTRATKKLLKMAASHSYDPRTVANMCFGAAVARVDTLDEALATQFLAHLAKDQQPQMAKYTPKQLTVVGWSFAMLQSKEDGFLKSIFAEAATRPAKDFDIKDLPKLLWAMGRSQVKDAQLINNVSKYLNATSLDAMEPNDLSGLMWGLGKLGMKEDALVRKVVDEVVVKRNGFEAGGFSLQSMSRFMWGLAALPHKDERIIASALDVTSRRARFLRPQSRTDLSFAMWTFGVKDFEKHLAQADAEVEARRKKAEQAKSAFLANLQQRAVELANRRKTEATGMAAAPST